MNIILSIVFFLVVIISMIACIIIGRVQVFNRFQQKTFEILEQVDENTTNKTIKLINTTIMLMIQILFNITDIKALVDFIDQNNYNTIKESVDSKNKDEKE